ncbi:MAG: hypothetical protein ABJB47_04500 [Actinomycetota bacterium]
MTAGSARTGRPKSRKPVTGFSGPGVSETDGTKTYRLPGPIIMWWVWLIFVAANLVDLAVQGRDWESVQITVGLLAITTLVYIATLRPRMITDAEALTMRNPLRDHRVPWGRVSDIFLSESMQVQTTAEDGSAGKLLHSWALYAPRKARVKADARGRRWDRSPGSRPGGYGQLPEEAQAIAKKTPTEVVAREINDKAKQARSGGATGGQIEVTWAWRPLAVIAVAWLVLVLAITLH